MTPRTRQRPATGEPGAIKVTRGRVEQGHDTAGVKPQPIIEPQSHIEVDPRWGGVLDCVMACQGDDCAWRPFECRLIGGES